jgi:hypothetical protein
MPVLVGARQLLVLADDFQPLDGAGLVRALLRIELGHLLLDGAAQHGRRKERANGGANRQPCAHAIARLKCQCHYIFPPSPNALDAGALSAPRRTFAVLTRYWAKFMEPRRIATIPPQRDGRMGSGIAEARGTAWGVSGGEGGGAPPATERSWQRERPPTESRSWRDRGPRSRDRLRHVDGRRAYIWEPRRARR